MRASIRQVAERAQVSPMTVSRVLRGRKHQVTDETYERVLLAVRELNYVPVRSAVQNYQVETNTIGVVPYYQDATRNLFDSLTFEGLRETASRSGYDLFLMLRGEAEWMANREELRFLDRRTDGFIFISPGIGEWETALETLVEHEIPVVVCYRRAVPQGVVWVDPDNESILRLALDCLFRYGHSRIAYVAGPKVTMMGRQRLADISVIASNFDEKDRREAFACFMKENGHEEWSHKLFELADPEWIMQPEEAQAIFDSGATAVICVNDHIALQLWNLAEKAGLKIPQDLSIIGVDDQLPAEHRGLTSVAFGYDEVGHQAVQAWIELRQGANPADCCRVVPVHLVERDSVCQPRNSL